MNNYKFSATTAGFYPIEMLDSYKQAGTLPADLVDVTDEIYDEFTSQPPEGKTRGSNPQGLPAWVNIPQPTPEQMRSQAAYRKQSEMAEAEDVIAPLERAVKHNMATDEDKVKLDAWERYSVLLSRVDVDKPEWPTPPGV